MKKLLDVGQCDADHSRITDMLRSNFEVEIHRAHTTDEALEMVNASQFDLVLINRLLDVNGEPGVEILKQIKGNTNSAETVVMLVSNFEDAQDAAVELGAMRGFGKAGLSDPETVKRLGEVL